MAAAPIKKILIADDEPDILEIVGYNLQKEGYEVHTAKNGDEAVDLAKKIKPDLLILDIMMPKKTGIQVCEILRAQIEFKDTLIIFLTAMSDEASQITGLEIGADDYVNKPISPKVLISRVNALFRRVSPKEASSVIQFGKSTISNLWLLLVAMKRYSLKKNLNFCTYSLLDLAAFFYATKYFHKFGVMK
jgi:two-component system alkaline phosphatase synthesis response regulator PhoP